MAVAGVSDFIQSQGINKNQATKNPNELSMDDFFTLMVAQLKNQDMMEPMDNTQFINQMTQFSMVSALNKMSEMVNLQYSSTLIGKLATVATVGTNGQMLTDTGLIEGVNLFNNAVQVVINGSEYGLENIMTLNDASALTNQTSGSYPLISNAVLIGKTATILHNTDGGGVESVRGVIDGVRLSDGLVYAMIGDRSYPLKEITAINETAQGEVEEAQPAGDAGTGTGNENQTGAVNDSENTEHGADGTDGQEDQNV